MLQAAEGEVHLPPVCRSLQRLILFVAVLGLAPGLLRGAAATRTNLTFDASVTVVESGEEPAPVRRATEDLLNDFSKVFGQRPALAIQLEEAGPIAILIADRSRVHAGIQCPLPTGTESFAFSTVRVPGRQPLKQIICLTGADMRGTILRNLPVFADISGRRSDVSVDRQATGEAYLHYAARELRARLSQACLSLSRILSQRRRSSDRLDSRRER